MRILSFVSMLALALMSASARSFAGGQEGNGPIKGGTAYSEKSESMSSSGAEGN